MMVFLLVFLTQIRCEKKNHGEVLCSTVLLLKKIAAVSCLVVRNFAIDLMWQQFHQIISRTRNRMN